MHIELLASAETGFAADSVEWCPQVGSQDLFVCGTYHLIEKAPQADAAESPETAASRRGRIDLYRFDRAADELALLDSHETAAILDMKWLRRNADDAEQLLAAADALGNVLLYRLTAGKLEAAASCALNPDESVVAPLTLAIDWRPTAAAAAVGAPRIAASDSAGKVSLLEHGEAGDLRVLSQWPVHSFEAWTCCFDRCHPDIVYTGGDDMLLHVLDTRVAEARVQTNRSHGAGVTALLSCAYGAEHRLVTGSYDEQLRVFDTRRLRTPVAELPLGGGIWRIRQNARRQEWLLCANMYRNFAVVALADAFDALSVVAEFNEHKSICYGADWCAERPTDGGGDVEEHLMATCSFYDRRLCVAKVTRKL